MMPVPAAEIGLCLGDPAVSAANPEDGSFPWRFLPLFQQFLPPFWRFLPPF
jgi:hypothetical protein